MNVITQASKIDGTLSRLIKNYRKCYIATAWASLGSNSSRELLRNKDKIARMIVGTHFYQTHPNFIKNFIRSKKVKFILKTNGVFHPKVYMFINSATDWECIVGSANFTSSALTKNEEVVMHITSTDPDSKKVYKTILAAISHYWKESEAISRDEYNNYFNIWNKNKKKIKSLEGEYGGSKSSKPLVKSEIFSLSWSQYYRKIRNDKFHSFKGRVKLLGAARSYFIENDNFSLFDKISRREVAGIASGAESQSDVDWGWFGSMKGAGKFQNRINTNNICISNALDEIPLEREINRSDYLSFVREFKKAFPDGGAGVAIASRLLAIKRPDYFVCLDKKNRPKLCAEFDISQSISFEEYWDEIIERIIDSVWWQSEKPRNKSEAKAWDGRSAMLDSIFYEEE